MKNGRVVWVVASALCAGWALAAMPQGATDVVEVAAEVTSVTAESSPGSAEADPLDVAAVTDDLFPASVECAESEPLYFTPDVSPGASSTDELRASETAANCKRCQDRPWCKCTYNGLPRVSCNPCCYGNLGIPQVCLD